ncbi:protein 5NUC-like [Haemaphysalis longicornis]
MWGPAVLAALCFVVHADYASAYPKTLYGGSNLHLTILHTNDIHSRIFESDKRGVECGDSRRDRSGCYGGVARIAHKAREIKSRNRNTLFLNAGGFFQGTLLYSVLRHKIVSHAMTRMGYDAVGLGNNEFDDGPQELAPFVRDMRKAGVPVLGTNVDTFREPRFRGMALPKSHVVTMSGVKVALLSVVTRKTVNIANPGGIRILPEVESINSEIWRLKQQGVKIFILVSHVGFEFDKHLAVACPDLDIIVGGHSQTFLYPGTPPTQEDRRRVEGTYPFSVRRQGRPSCLIVQDYRYGKYLGKLEVLFNGKGDVTHWRGKPILLDQTVGQDQNILRSLTPFKRTVEDALRKVVGSTKVLLEASDKVCRYRECNMANLMADSFFDYYTNRKSSLPHAWSDVNAAIINGGTARESIRQNSNVTLRDLQRAMPIDNELVLMKMQGSQLQKMFEHAVSNFTWWPDLDGKFLQVAGIRVTYDLRRKSGWRVVWLKILCANCSVPRYEDINFSKTYTIVTTSFIANGGDGFKFDKGVLKRGDGVSAFYVFTKYFTKLSPIKTAEEGRIVVKNLPPKGKPTSPGQSPTPGFAPRPPQSSGPLPGRPQVRPQIPRPAPSRPQPPPFAQPPPQIPAPAPGLQPTTQFAPRPPQITVPAPGPVPAPFTPGQSQTTGSGQGPSQFPGQVQSQSQFPGPVQGQASSAGIPQGPPTATGIGPGLVSNAGYGQGPFASPGVGPVQAPSAGFPQAPNSGFPQGQMPSTGTAQAPNPGFGQGPPQSTGYLQSQTTSPGYGPGQQQNAGLQAPITVYGQGQPPATPGQAPITPYGQSPAPAPPFPSDNAPGGWSSA